MSEDNLVLNAEQKFALVSIKDRFLAGDKVDISLMHLIQAKRAEL